MRRSRTGVFPHLEECHLAELFRIIWFCSQLFCANDTHRLLATSSAVSVIAGSISFMFPFLLSCTSHMFRSRLFQIRRPSLARRHARLDFREKVPLTNSLYIDLTHSLITNKDDRFSFKADTDSLPLIVPIMTPFLANYCFHWISRSQKLSTIYYIDHHHMPKAPTVLFARSDVHPLVRSSLQCRKKAAS